MTGTGFITYPFLEIGRFNFGYNRSTEYSFEEAEAYYLENSVRLIYTHRLFGEVDVQGQAARSFFDYGNRAGSAERRDSLESYNGNLGYNLRNRTRISANYDYARRRSPDTRQPELHSPTRIFVLGGGVLVMVNLFLAALFFLQASAPRSRSRIPTYVVGSTDVLSIRVFDEPQLTCDCTVDADGSITFPLVGAYRGRRQDAARD